MLLNDFFEISSIEVAEMDIHCVIRLNADHAVFSGHFPGQPVTPGVCMMQMMAEIASLGFNKKLSIRSASQIKFLIPILPTEQPLLTVKIAGKVLDESISISGRIENETLTFFKFKGKLE